MGLEISDYIAIIVYALAIVGIGVIMAKKASGGLDEYFLGGRTLPWYLLGTSGMANWFDLTGTMVITSFLFLIGPRALFVEFRGGAVLILVFLLCFTAKWHRRSGCMTGAEWMQFRFGKGSDADAARLLTAIVSILPVIGMIAYLIRGTGQFLSMFFPFAPSVCAVLFALVAVAYTASAGFYGVVIADILQSTLIVAGAIVLSIMAFNLFTPTEVNGVVTATAGENLKAMAYSVTGNADWTQALPSWKVHMPADPEYKFFQFLIILMAFYMVQQSITGLGSGSDQKYFAAKSDKECGKLNLLISVLISVRWPMMIGLAILGLSVVNGYFNNDKDLEKQRTVETAYYVNNSIAKMKSKPAEYAAVISELESVLGFEWGDVAKIAASDKYQDVNTVLKMHGVQSDKTWTQIANSSESFDPVLLGYLDSKLGKDWKGNLAKVGVQKQASDLIRAEYPKVEKANWHETTSAIINGSNPELAKKLEQILGKDWKKKLLLVGFHGETDPERILPAVIREKVPAGWMGVLLVTLLAASMSTFGSTVNSASSYAVKDIYQRWLRPNAGRRELITASWMTTVLIAAIGFFLSLVFDSINDVWDWIIMSVTTGLFVPGFLRMYWWRMNGWGVAFGMAFGGIAAIAQRLLQNSGIEFAPWEKFGFVAVFAFAATIIGCLCTKPTDMNTLVYFYKKTRPFGLWGPVRKYLSKEQLSYIDGENRRDIAALPFAFLYQVTLFLLPMLIIIHEFGATFISVLSILVISIIALYLLWYKNLRPDRKMELEPDSLTDKNA